MRFGVHGMGVFKSCSYQRYLTCPWSLDLRIYDVNNERSTFIINITFALFRISDDDGGGNDRIRRCISWTVFFQRARDIPRTLYAQVHTCT